MNASTNTSIKAGITSVDIALDVTPHSSLVVESLNRFVSPQHAKCEFLYAVPQFHDHDRKFSALDQEVEEETIRVVNEQFDAYTETLSKNRMMVENRLFLKGEDTVEEAILEKLEEQTPDLLVLGMHANAPRRKRWTISSTSYAIATHAPCSVLVVKRPPLQAQKLKVLFATDGSEHADKALQDLCMFLPKETSEIMLFNVVSVSYYMMPLAEPYINYQPLEHAMKGEATQMLERTKKGLVDNGYRVTDSYFLLGDPVEQILKEAEEKRIDLIVMGSHGAGGRLTSWLLGSVSSKVLENSHASVAILK